MELLKKLAFGTQSILVTLLFTQLHKLRAVHSQGAVGSSFVAGPNAKNQKSYTVTAGGITYLGDPFTFTKANIATFKAIY
jgi:hypothetical protein